MVVDGIDVYFYYINIKMDQLISQNSMDLFPAIGTSSLKISIYLIVFSSVSLEKRTFRTFDFFNKLCSHLRPISLAFFQVAWDASVTNTFHNILGKFND
jgi:hypothetical protein